MLNKVLFMLVVIGFSCAAYFTFQWWDSTRAVEKVTEEEINEWESQDQAEEPPQVVVKNQDKPKQPRYSNELHKFDNGEKVGRLIIPLLNKGYSTYWGTDEQSLHQGVGMFISKWTTTPDEKRHTVLSGHRETVFTQLGEIEKGAPLFYEYEGKRYKYEVEKTWVTDEDDRSVIVDHEDPTLTLTTCYPFDFIGSAPERFIVQSRLVDVQEIE
ncbi:class D sortase [Halobacillus trueperi]|uniref:Class D sortase n=1 Tax=Halobacillus trueperi TaxID=156205 RepID=A0A3E0JBS1_9BACI|nr:class D sortase [Halobacillus trueperi]REJ10385.1 class D sortase [Halobacillus trueperi]